MRRSTRLALSLPVVVTSLDPARRFCEECKTVTINAHGCGVISLESLAVGTAILVDLISEHRSAKAKIVALICLEENQTGFLLGIEFAIPGNFWGIDSPPVDWSQCSG